MMDRPYPTESANEDSWINAESLADGRALLLCIRPDLERFDGKQSFPKKLVFTRDFSGDQEYGLPNDEQFDQMHPFEDALVESLEKGRCALLAYVHTGRGIREWHFYIAGLHEIKLDLRASHRV